MKRTYNGSEHSAGAQWLPESRHKAARAAAGAPDFFERYGEGFDPQLGMGDVEVWIPMIE
jgi:predicted transcriptional regulator YdeE